MALVAIPGMPLVQIGTAFANTAGAPSSTTSVVDAANEAVMFIGYIFTSDGGSHTVDTTGSSSLEWLTGAVTFASASTTVKVGIASIDTAASAPGRAVNVADVITFDVSRSLVGGGGGITANAFQTHAPDTGTKTIANGDLVAFCIQMTARGGTDSVTIGYTSAVHSRPHVATFLGGSYSSVAGLPNCFITFSDGATGVFLGGDVFRTIGSIAFNTSSGTKEYGQLFNLPFPIKICGIYGWCSTSNDFDLVLYSAPLGTPVAEKTVSVDASTLRAVGAGKFYLLFPAAYTYTAGTDIAAVFKPTTISSMTTYYKTMANIAHRVAEPFGASGYGIGRSSGAFANVNSSLDHFYVGLIASAFDAGGAAGRAVQVNNDSLVA